MAKKFEIKFVENNGRMKISAINEGFNVLELIGMLDAKKQDIIDQMNERVKFKRVCKHDDGSACIIESVKDIEKEED